MPRQTLPGSPQDASGNALFPSLQKEMNRLLDQFRSGIPMMDDDAKSTFSGPLFPAIDVVETDDTLDISAEVPGIQEDDLEVTISGDVLTLKGTKSADHEENEEGYHLIERRYGSFRRQIPLGFTPEEGAVGTKFADGILSLRIKKPAETKASVQKINIKKT